VARVQPVARKKARAPVGQRAVHPRTERDFTARDLAHETGLAPEFMGDVEAGMVLPPVAFLIRIGKALSIDAGSFVARRGGEGRL
jgi:transcriptional regulator with XRE-family HTH domain